jgi:putative transcriptional regulator
VIGSEVVYACIGVGCGFGLGFVRYGAAFQGWIYRAARLAGNINFSSILLRKYCIPGVCRFLGRKSNIKMESWLDNNCSSSYSVLESWLYMERSITNRVKELRIAHGWTQEQLAQATGVSRQSINSIERDRYVPSLELALKFAQIFTCSTDEIFQLENQP